MSDKNIGPASQGHQTTFRPERTAGDAGWHASRYNLYARIPKSDRVAVVNLFAGSCGSFSPLEMGLLYAVEELNEHHPIIERFAKRGIVVNFDELAALDMMGRGRCASPNELGLTICPTLACNFDCPYCFERHGGSPMSGQVQDDVVRLAERMLDTSGARRIHVTWFGGEPLLAPEVISSVSDRLIALAEQRGCSYVASVVTNGYLLTQDMVDLLARCKVQSARITIDGIGATHDATRRLAGGGPTFERIVSNLRNASLPFSVHIRHNMHEGNVADSDELRALIERMAKESGNSLRYFPSMVSANDVADERGEFCSRLSGDEATSTAIRLWAEGFRAARPYNCRAQLFWNVSVDDKGNLHKCWEEIDKPWHSFGTAHDWDPANPIATATTLDNLTRYINTSSPIPDDECRSCPWLPLCAGGCPQKRLLRGRSCLLFKDEPERYVLALYDLLKSKRNRGSRSRS